MNDNDHDALIEIFTQFLRGGIPRTPKACADAIRFHGGLRIDLFPGSAAPVGDTRTRAPQIPGEFTFKRANRPPARRQAERARSARTDADACERWRVFEDGVHVYDLWLANGRGDLYFANEPTADRFGVRRGQWEVLGSDPSERLERKAGALARGWARRSYGRRR